MLNAMTAEPVVGYSITYPMGVVAVIACILLAVIVKNIVAQLLVAFLP